MENKFTPEFIEKAKQAKSPEELASLVEENNIAISADEVKELFERLNPTDELSEDELDNVSGGGDVYSYTPTSLTCMKCKMGILIATSQKTGRSRYKCGCSN